MYRLNYNSRAIILVIFINIFNSIFFNLITSLPTLDLNENRKNHNTSLIIIYLYVDKSYWLYKCSKISKEEPRTLIIYYTITNQYCF